MQVVVMASPELAGFFLLKYYSWYAGSGDYWKAKVTITWSCRIMSRLASKRVDDSQRRITVDL